ncbi:MAG: lysophospholipid acyltransferase family protein [Vicinamibacterales bacterium]
MSGQDPRDAAVEPGWRRSWRQRIALALIAGLGAPLLRLLALTWRVETVGAEHLAAAGDGGAGTIYALWHGRILHCLWYWRDRGIVVVTSENFDGEWIARIIRRFGFGTARGSSSRRGARVMRELLRTVGQAPVAFTVDGPRGPREVVQPGVAWLARATGHPVVCVHAEADRAWTLRSWDRTQIPKPFSRMVMAIGPVVQLERDSGPDAVDAARRAIDAALGDAAIACRRALEGSRR